MGLIIALRKIDVLKTSIFVKVKTDHRSKFPNLSNWKEEA